MAWAWLVVVLLFVPGIAAGQVRITPTGTVPGAAIDISPRTPPPPTIPSAPDVALPLPLPPPPTTRPVKTFDVRPTLGVSEEYSDNFNRASRDPVSNFRSSISPGLLVLFERGFLTGQAAYTPSVFYDTVVEQIGVRHIFNGQLTWQTTPLLKLSLSDTLLQSDDPALADRLNLRRGRQEFTSNLFSLTSDYSLLTIDTQEYYRLSTFSSSDATTTSQTLGVSGTKSLGQIHTLKLGYEYLRSETTVENAGTLTINGPSADSTTTGHQVTGSFSRDLTKNTTAGVSAAYAARERISGTGRSEFTRRSVSLFNNYVVPEKLIVRGDIGLAQLNSGSASGRLLLTSNTEVAYYLGDAVLGLRFERGFSETFTQGQDLGIVETSGMSGSVSYRFSPLLTGLVTGGYRENKFTGVGGGGQTGRDDKTITATANLSYQVLRWLTATMDYTHTDTTSSVPQAGFVENRVRAALNASFY